jgi:hypothetical protein
MMHKEVEERVFLKSHPDYVSLEKLQRSIEMLGTEHVDVRSLLITLEKMPEYLVAK